MNGGLEPFAALMLMGARVREVKDLPEGHCWLPKFKMLIIDSGMDDDMRSALALTLVTRVAELDQEVAR